MDVTDLHVPSPCFLEIQQRISFELPHLDNIPIASPWFTNVGFREADLHFRILLSASSSSYGGDRQVSLHVVRERERDLIMKREKGHPGALMHHRKSMKYLYESDLDVGISKASLELAGCPDKILSLAEWDGLFETFPIEIAFGKFEKDDLKSPLQVIFKAECYLPHMSDPEQKQVPQSNSPSEVLSCLHNGLLSDVRLRVAGQTELRAHRCVLAASSPVFRSMFQHDLLERQVGVVDIKKSDGTYVPAEVMEAALRHTYGKELGRLDASTFVELLVLADQYEMAALKATCEDVLSGDSYLDVMQLVAVAHDHRAERLLEATVRRIKKSSNRGDLYQSTSFQEILKTRPDIVEEIYKRL